MGTEAMFLCGCVLCLLNAALAAFFVVAAIWITAMGGICSCFLTSKFLEVHMASLMAAREVNKNINNTIHQ
ncbi:hypothetical protein CRENBAI_023682 [Crenichthys baileyi]|uniref:Uncharacterized protein n=1 Tax=Crenichthys baileyi TaxID=28760 RepID=A0AAV9RHW5_9TELE